jgi:hypothetical protein
VNRGSAFTEEPGVFVPQDLEGPRFGGRRRPRIERLFAFPRKPAIASIFAAGRSARLQQTSLIVGYPPAHASQIMR